MPKYRILGMHLMTGKLDWVLLRNIQVGVCSLPSTCIAANCWDVWGKFSGSVIPWGFTTAWWVPL